MLDFGGKLVAPRNLPYVDAVVGALKRLDQLLELGLHSFTLFTLNRPDDGVHRHRLRCYVDDGLDQGFQCIVT